MKYRAVIYCRVDDGFWRYTNLCSSKETAKLRAEAIIKKYKIQSPEIVITEYSNQ